MLYISLYPANQFSLIRPPHVITRVDSQIRVGLLEFYDVQEGENGSNCTDKLDVSKAVTVPLGSLLSLMCLDVCDQYLDLLNPSSATLDEFMVLILQG